MTTTGAATVLIATFLGSAVEAIEMVIIVVGVGATRGWRATLIGAASGFAVLAVIVAALGAALNAVPIGPVRLVVGSLLLVFGLQWFRKGVMRVAARGFAGTRGADAHEEADVWTGPGLDWTAFTLAFKGVTLEGLEIAFLVLALGAGADQLGVAVVGGVGALVIIGAAGILLRRAVQRIPRSFLQLIVGVLLTTFGSFWSLEGIGVGWPGSDAAIIGLLALYTMAGAVYVAVERARVLGFRPAA